MTVFEDHYSTLGEEQALPDFCLWPYPPLQPTSGKLHSFTLLLQSFQATGMPPQALALCQRIRQAMGPGNTVWGVKYQNGQISWEFYFYDYQRLQRTRSVARLLNAIAPLIKCPLHIAEDTPYFMFSIDLDSRLLTAATPTLPALDLYIGNIGSDVSSGISYRCSSERRELRNLYYFFDAASQWDDIVGKALCSAHLQLPGLDLEQLIWPRLRDCQTIVVANKRAHDGLYYSRISVDQLIYFMQRLNYPAVLSEFIGQHRCRLDHMLYDVGVDYTMVDGRINYHKSSYYGYF